VATRRNDENNSFHAFPIGSGNIVELIQPSTSDHERAKAAAHEWIAISVGVDRLDDAHRNAAHLGSRPRVIAHEWRHYDWLLDLHRPHSPELAKCPLRPQRRRRLEFSDVPAKIFFYVGRQWREGRPRGVTKRREPRR